MKSLSNAIIFSALIIFTSLSASAQDQLKSQVGTAPPYSIQSPSPGEFVIIPHSNRSDVVTLQYLPNPGAVPVPPLEDGILAKSKRTCETGVSINTGNWVFACRTCQNWKMVRHCKDPSKPSTCRNEWIPDGQAETECGKAPSWMVGK